MSIESNVRTDYWGQLPKGWQFIPIRSGFDLIGSGTTPPSGNSDFYDGVIPWVTTSELRESWIIDTERKLTPIALDEFQSLKLYPVKTVLVAMYGATIGRVGVLGITACVNQAVCALSQASLFEPIFASYALQASRDYFFSVASGGGQTNINAEKVADHFLPCPPLATQRAIAAFLDRETAKIDALLDAEQRLLALLTEKRQALITHAVTRGLNPAASMQDSGVEWIGAVPVGWEIPPVNARYEVALGKMLDTKTIIGNNLAPYLRNIDVQWHKINVKNLPEMDFNSNDKNIYALRKGDVLICEGGEIGRTAIWLGELETCYYQKALHRLRPITTMDYPQFFTYVMEAAVNIGVFAAEGNQSTIQHLTAEKLRAFRFPSPPFAEQRHIIEHIQTKTTKIDQLIATAQHTIETLHERRTALISEAVTGQLPIAE